VLLRNSLRQRIELMKIDDDWRSVELTAAWERKYLWRKRLTRFPRPLETSAIGRVDEIAAIAPDAIDVVASRHGQTLRYHGLPFARVRRVMERDRIWFGIEGSNRQSLDEYHQRDWWKLLHDLQTYRNESCRDRRHWFYRAAGEAWLDAEPMIRRRFVHEWAAKADDGAFRQRLGARLARHPEWEPVLYPERFEPKPPAAAVAPPPAPVASAPPAPQAGGSAPVNPSVPLSATPEPGAPEGAPAH